MFFLYICMGTFDSPAEISKLDPISVLMFRLTRGTTGVSCKKIVRLETHLICITTKYFSELTFSEHFLRSPHSAGCTVETIVKWLSRIRELHQPGSHCNTSSGPHLRFERHPSVHLLFLNMWGERTHIADYATCKLLSA